MDWKILSFYWIAESKSQFLNKFFSLSLGERLIKVS